MSVATTLDMGPVARLQRYSEKRMCEWPFPRLSEQDSAADDFQS